MTRLAALRAGARLRREMARWVHDAFREVDDVQRVLTGRIGLDLRQVRQADLGRPQQGLH